MAKKSTASRGPRKMGVTKTVQPVLTTAAPAAPAKYGQTAGEISPTFGVGQSYGRGGSKRAKAKRSRHY